MGLFFGVVLLHFLQGYTGAGVHRGTQGYTEVHRDTQGYTGVHMNTQGYTYTGLQRSAQAEPLVTFEVKWSG